MKIRFLGTGTSGGVPQIACSCEVCRSPDPCDRRLRSSVLISEGNHQLLIDAGPDFREQILRNNIQHLDAILLTHGHRDHIAGLDDTRPLTYASRRPMPIYADKTCLHMVKDMFAYAFKPAEYPGLPNFELHELTNDLIIHGVPVQLIYVQHLKLPVLGFRIGDFCYITDANYIAEEEYNKIRGVKYFVINALRKTDHISHFNLAEALEVIRKVNPQKAYITHISHQMGLHREVNHELPQNVELAYDGLEIHC